MPTTRRIRRKIFMTAPSRYRNFLGGGVDILPRPGGVGAGEGTCSIMTHDWMGTAKPSMSAAGKEGDQESRAGRSVGTAPGAGATREGNAPCPGKPGRSEWISCIR